MYKKFYLPIALVLFSSMILIREYYSGISLGQLATGIIPCVERPENSFPCYGRYDLYIIMTAILAILTNLVRIFILICKTKSTS